MRKGYKNRLERNLDFQNRNQKENINLKRELRDQNLHRHHPGEFRDRGLSAYGAHRDHYRHHVGDHRPSRRHHYRRTELRPIRSNPRGQDFSMRHNRRRDGHVERESFSSGMHRSHERKMRLRGRSMCELFREKRRLEARLFALRRELRHRFAHRQHQHSRYSTAR